MTTKSGRSSRKRSHASSSYSSQTSSGGAKKNTNNNNNNNNGRLASKKAELDTNEVDAAPGGQTLVRLHRPTETVSETEILGTDASAAAAVVDILEEIGLC